MSVRLRACACVYAWTCVYVCTNVTVWISLRVPLWSCIGLCVTTVWLNLIAYFDVLHPSWNHLVEFRANHLKSDEINFAHVCWTCCSFLRQFPPETSSSISPTSGTRLRSTVYRTAIAPSRFLLTPQPVRPNKTDFNSRGSRDSTMYQRRLQPGPPVHPTWPSELDSDWAKSRHATITRMHSYLLLLIFFSL